MISFIGGSEPYLVDCRVKALIGQLHVPELNYMESDAFSEDVVLFLSCQPVGDDKRVVYLTVDDLSACDISLFASFQKTCPKTATLVVRFRTYDARRNFYKKLKKEAIISILDKESALPKLAEIVSRETAAAGAVYEPGVLEEFLRRENYSGREDITIYNILSDLKNLIALDKKITMEHVSAIIPEMEQDNVFAVARMIRTGDVNSLRKQAALLRGNEIGALSALLREYRLAYKASFYPAREIGGGNIVLKGMSRDKLLHGIDLIVDSIDQIKRGSVPLSVAFESVVLALMKEAL